MVVAQIKSRSVQGCALVFIQQINRGLFRLVGTGLCVLRTHLNPLQKREFS
jgi:hypothetical protein